MTDDELLARVMRRIIRTDGEVFDLSPSDVLVDATVPISPEEHHALERAGAKWMTRR